MAEEAKTLVFEDDEARQAALAEIPDDAPPGVNVDSWIAEQEALEKEIMEAPLKGSEEAAPVEQPTATEEPPATEEPVQVEQGEDEYVDFSALGKVKKADLPEDLRNYPSAPEMLKQAAHARKYANKAEEKLRAYEDRMAELEAAAKSVPEMQRQLNELKMATSAAEKAVEAKPSISSGQRAELKESLKAINEKISGLKDFDTGDPEAFQSVLKDTVGAFGETLNDLDSVRGEFSKYRKETEERYNKLESSIKSVSETTKQAEARRKVEQEQKAAEKGLAELQSIHAELKTSKPLYSEDRNDVETAIVRFANRVYGRKPNNFDEVNRLVAAYNANDEQLMGICKQDGISPADFGISTKDIRNYGILMNIYWRQRGESLDPSTGKRIPVTDWRGQKVTFPDFEATFINMKEKGGINQLEKEAEIIEAEKKGQTQLEASIHKRDTSPPVLGPSGAPPEGQEMSEEQAQEILGIVEGKTTVDEETMEKLLRQGNQKGWDMWAAWVRAHEAAGMGTPKPESYWKKPTQ